MTRPYDSRWQTIRLGILERDGYQCQIRAPRCTNTATHVDHIIPLDEGGARLDPHNLRAACPNCNLTRHTGRKAALIAALTPPTNHTPSRTW